MQVYPIEFTCFDNLSWYSNEAKFRIAARNSSEFSELHAKGWEDILKILSIKTMNIKLKKNKIICLIG